MMDEDKGPSGPNQKYHIVSMTWFNKWQAYTNSSHAESSDSPGPINADIKPSLISQ